MIKITTMMKMTQMMMIIILTDYTKMILMIMVISK